MATIAIQKSLAHREAFFVVKNLFSNETFPAVHRTSGIPVVNARRYRHDLALTRRF